MMQRGTRPRQGTGVAVGLTGTLLVHAGALALLYTAVRPARPGPPVYAVELVAAPAPQPEARPAPEAVTRPAPDPPAPKLPEPKTSKPAPVPPKPKPVTTPQKVEPTPRSASPVTPAPGETPSTGRDAVTVSTPGLQFPFPDYLRNIVEAVYRRWQRPFGNAALRAEVSFMILRDGSVNGIKLTKSSGSFSFDLSAQGAVEAAGTAGAFGPLPDGWPADVLPVSFYFTPRTQ